MLAQQVVEEMLETGRIRLDEGDVSLRHPEFPEALSHIDRDTGQMLQRIIRERRPHRSLEIGLAYGVSTLFICEAVTEIDGFDRHIVLDPYQHGKWRGLGLRNLARAGCLGLVDFREEPSEIALPRLLADGITIDFAFVDGLHRFEQVMTELYYVNRLLSPGGVVVFDDANRRSVSRAIRHALTYPCYQVLAASGAPAPGASWKTALRRRAAGLAAVRRLVRPDVLTPDWDLGIGGRAVALLKTSEDRRHTYFDAEF